MTTIEKGTVSGDDGARVSAGLVELELYANGVDLNGVEEGTPDDLSGVHRIVRHAVLQAIEARQSTPRLQLAGYAGSVIRSRFSPGIIWSGSHQTT